MSLRDAIASDVVTEWREFKPIRAPLHPGAFRSVAIVGPQGAGKTTLAINMVLRRLYWGLKHAGAWSPADGTDPLDNDFNPFRKVAERIHGVWTARRLYSELAVFKLKVISPLEIARVINLPRPATAGLIFDEVALWSRDVSSWWKGDKKKALEFLRQVVANVRGVTPFLVVVAQDVHLIPSPIRYPIDIVIDVYEFRREGEENDGTFKGYVVGDIKLRNVRGARTPRSEASYYKVQEFRLPVYNSPYLMELDLSNKKRTIAEFVMGRGPKNPAAGDGGSVAGWIPVSRPQVEYFGTRFLLALAGNAVESTVVDDLTVIYRNVAQAAQVCSHLKRLFPSVVKDCRGITKERTVEVRCRVSPCHDVLKNMATLYVAPAPSVHVE
ncbi:ATP-binding protein [Pyrobaculum sp.]|uniref:ATP-binding protein n=1 Tax=Pyrobaculum sp. TaxID=2004705 RepID=UPI003D1367A7